MALPKVGVEAVIEGMAKFEADSKKVNKAFSDMGTSTKNLGSIASGVTSKITSLVGSLLKVGAIGAGAGIVAIGAGLFKAGQAGLSMNDAMEQASAKINAFTKDSAKTTEILEMIRDRASKTPFEFQEMANAAAGLLPASRQAGVGLAEIIEQAEILAASNPAEGLEGAAFALREAVSGDFTSIIERFNLPRTMINQLKEEGLPNLEIVSRAMKELGFDTDLVSALAETAQGRWSTFKDTLTNMAATATQPIFDAFSQGLGDINGWLVANEPMLTQMATVLAGQISEAITTVAAKAQELFAAFQSGGFTGLAEALGIPPEVITNIQSVVTEVQRLIDIFQAEGLSGIFADLKASLQTASTDAIAQVPTFLGDLLATISTYLKDNWPTIQAALVEWSGKFFDWVADTAGKIGEKLQPLLDGIFDWLTSPQAQETFTNIGKTWSAAVIDSLLNSVSNVDSLLSVLTALAEGLLIATAAIVGTLVLVGAQIVAGIWSGFLEALGVDLKPAAVTELGSILKQIGNDIVTIAQELGKRLVASIKTGWNNAWTTITDWGEKFNAIWEAGKKILSPEKWMEVGQSVIDGILEGIKKNQDKVIEMLKSMMADVIKGAKDVIGFGSPATEFMPIGESMVQGMLLGAKKEKFAKKFVDDLNMGGIARSLGAGGGQWRNFRNIIKQTIGLNFDQLMTSGMSAAQIFGKIQEVAARFNFPPQMAAEFAAAEGLIEHLTSSVAEFQKAMRLENMGRMVQIGGQFASIGQSLVDMLKPVDDGRIQTLQDFLSGKAEGRMFAHPLTGVLEEMVVLQQDGLEVALNRTLAQQELNRLLEEQRRQEELIAQQKKSQEQLSFLQQQIELIKMGKEVGGNIFQGIKFGLDASVTDLLNATNNVVTAMVDQINQDLQISSPSKVMARIGQQMMAGLQGGIASMTPVLNAQLSASVAGPLSPSMAGAMNSNSYSTTNMFNIGGNTISNGMNAAEFESRVLQVIRRNL